MFDSHLRPKSIVETDPDNVWVCVSSLTGSPDPNLPVTVYYSHNGGRNWGYYNFEGSESCGSGFIASCDGNTAWIFIDDQGLMKTSDGGKTWVNINHSLLRFENTGLYFFDEKTGIAIFNVDNPGWINDTLALFRSVDGGYNWNEIPSTKWGNVVPGEAIDTRNFNSIAHAGDTIGFATGAGRIFISTDRGLSWQTTRIHDKPSEYLVSLCLSDARRFAVTSIGTNQFRNKEPLFKPYYLTKVFVTSDGGSSWQPEKLIPAYFANITSIPGADSILIASSPGDKNYSGGTFISTNYGITFRQRDPYFNMIIGPAFSSINTGFAVAQGFDDQGNSIDNKIFRWNPDFHYRNLKTVKSVRNSKKLGGNIFHRTWETVKDFDFAFFPGDIMFTDSLHIWITLLVAPFAYAQDTGGFKGYSNRPDLLPELLRSSDGGKTWNMNLIPAVVRPDNYGRDISFFALDSCTAFLSTDLNYLMKTTDGGKTFSAIVKESSHGGIPRAIHFFNQYEGLALNSISSGLVVQKTYNGGSEWVTLDPGSFDGKILPHEDVNSTINPLSSIGDTIAFGTDLGRIWMSYDRGDNWKIISSGTSPFEKILSFTLLTSRKFAFSSESLTKYVDGIKTLERYHGETKIFVTEDGGKSWNLPVLLRDICVIKSIPGNDTIIIANNHAQLSTGSTYISTDSGRTFIKIDTFNISIARCGFYSVNHGFGLSSQIGDNNIIDKTNFIYRWNPEMLYKKKMLR